MKPRWTASRPCRSWTPSCAKWPSGGEATRPDHTLIRFRHQWRSRHGKEHELTDHLGNVRAVIGDYRQSEGGGIRAALRSYFNHYAFGLEMPGIVWKGGNSYRYGYNGKEQDADFANNYDYGFRIYNPAVGRFLSVDPLAASFPFYTPYQFAGNKPIAAIDLDGLEEVIRINYMNVNGEIGRTSVVLLKSNDLRAEASGIWRSFMNAAPGTGNQHFGQDVYFEGYDKYAGGSFDKGGRIIAPLRGELTVTVDGGEFTYFGYKREITGDAAYGKAVNDHYAGSAYDLSDGLDKLGQGITALGVGLSVVGAPEVGTPVMAAGGSVGFGADVIEATTDFTQGKIGYGIGKLLFSIPDAAAGGLLKKTLLPEVRQEVITSMMGLGANAIQNKLGDVKQSADGIEKKNMAELKWLFKPKDLGK